MHLQNSAGGESALERLKNALPQEKHRNIGSEEVREILFPNVGYNPFTLVDALFRQDHASVRRELIRFHPPADSLLVVLKLLLNRANEIRKATVGRGMGMSDADLVGLLGLKSRHPFVQKKILQRLHDEILRFPPEHLTNVYDFLVTLEKEFRRNVPPEMQMTVFQQGILPVFFKIPAKA